MSFRAAESQKRHNEIVLRLINDLRSKGYEDVVAAHVKLAGKDQPEKIYSEKAEMFFCPDVCAEKDGIHYLFEVETEDSITLSLTRVELECFAAHAKKSGGYFYLVIPKAAKKKAKTVLDAIDEKNRRKAFILTV